MNYPARFGLIFIGIAVGILVMTFIHLALQDAQSTKYQKLMVECGCAAYDVETGEWYSIETAAAPEPAPIPGPNYMETK